MKKIAFCFLIYNEIIYENLWYDFLKNSDKNKYNIYIHYKENKKLKHFEKYKLQLEEIIPTKYADISIVYAQNQLYKKAFTDENNYKFIILSQNCIPIKSFDYIYDFLTKDDSSYFNICNPGDFFSNGKEALKYLSYEKIHKAHKYCILNRTALDIIFKNLNFLNYFEKTYAPDELFYISLLFDKEKVNIINKSTTFTNWSSKGLKNYDNISEKELEDIYSSENLFARKFLNKCKIWNEKGFIYLDNYFNKIKNKINFEAVVIWGHPLHSHTHSYIHNAFARAFDYRCDKWYWLDNNKPFKEYNITLPKKCLYLTEGQVDSNIPLEPESYYILHNCKMEKYKNSIPYNHILGLQVFTKACNPVSKPLNNSEFIRFDGKTLYMPWGTDLHPHEIDKFIDNIVDINTHKTKECHFVGMLLDDPWKLCKETCNENNIDFVNTGGFKNNISVEENILRIQKSIIAPGFQEPWQVDNGYIPCRIFKNISYGKMGITNNPIVNELFNNKLIFDSNVKIATQKGIDFSLTPDTNLIKELMLEIRNKHTYLNRINDILEAFNKL
jgi:hypothetical protein